MSLLVLFGACAAAPVAVAAAPFTAAAATPAAQHVDFGCNAVTPVYGTVGIPAALDVSASAPITAEQGTTFGASVQPEVLPLPPSFLEGSTAVTLNTERDVSFAYDVSDASIESATLSGGSNLGAGTPTVSSSGGVVVLTLPGPFVAGQTVVPPELDLQLQPSSPVGTSVVVGFTASSTAYDFTANVTVAGSSFDAVVTCEPNSAAPLTSTIVLAPGDPAPQANVSGCAAAPGADCTFSVRLSAPRGIPVSVDFATVDGTAIAGTGYTAESGTLTFAVGVTTQSVTVPILGQVGSQPDSAFSLQLSNPDGVVLGNSSATGTILGHGPEPYLCAELGLVHRTVGSGTQVLQIPVELLDRWGHPTSTPYDVTADYTTADYTARSPGDYVAATGHLDFPANSTGTHYIDVTIPAGVGAPGPLLFVVGVYNDTNAVPGGIGPGLGFGEIFSDAS